MYFVRLIFFYSLVIDSFGTLCVTCLVKTLFTFIFNSILPEWKFTSIYIQQIRFVCTSFLNSFHIWLVFIFRFDQNRNHIFICCTERKSKTPDISIENHIKWKLFSWFVWMNPFAKIYFMKMFQSVLNSFRYSILYYKISIYMNTFSEKSIQSEYEQIFNSTRRKVYFIINDMNNLFQKAGKYYESRAM